MKTSQWHILSNKILTFPSTSFPSLNHHFHFFLVSHIYITLTFLSLPHNLHFQEELQSLLSCQTGSLSKLPLIFLPFIFLHKYWSRWLPDQPANGAPQTKPDSFWLSFMVVNCLNHVHILLVCTYYVLFLL